MSTKDADIDLGQDRAVSSVENSSFQAFKEVANESLGLRGDEDFELVPLNVVLSRIESLYSRELSQFDTIIANVQQDELYFTELGLALNEFRHRVMEAFALPHSKAIKLQCVPVEKVVFTAKTQSEAPLAFCDANRGRYLFNQLRGNHLFDFMLAHFMEQSVHFKRLNRGMRSRLVSYAGSLESVYSIWEVNKLGRVWTLHRDTLPKRAYADATNRLVDGLYSAVGFDGAYKIFENHLNPLSKFPLQFLYNVVIGDPKKRFNSSLRPIVWGCLVIMSPASAVLITPHSFAVPCPLANARLKGQPTVSHTPKQWQPVMPSSS
jgi:hypothetical protein